MSEPTKDERPAAPIDPQTTQLDTTKHVTPDEDTSKETTPIADEIEQESKKKPVKIPKGAELADAENPDKADLTTFPEDDDPLSLAGDFVDENGNGIDDRKENL